MTEQQDGQPPIIGRVLSQTYRVERLLGRGGMGAVYEATNVRLDKRVAIKVLAEHVGADARATARLEREARIASAVGHAHIVDVTDFNVGEGTAYMVMELLEGEDLEQLLTREQRLPLERAAHVVRQIAEALEAVHARGVVHRDLKPANVFLCARQAFADFVKVLDFGVSRAATLSSISVAQGSIVGSPYYMAPEQALEDLGEVGPWTDVYALGALTYRMLGGRAPFAHKKTMPQLLYAVVHERPTPLDGVDGAVNALLERAMAKHPAARVQGARELADALDGLAGVTPPKRRTDATPGSATVQLAGGAEGERDGGDGGERDGSERDGGERDGEGERDSADGRAETARKPAVGARSRGGSGRTIALVGVLLLLGAAGAVTYALWPETAGQPCRADDRADCQTQCRRGHGASCGSWLRMLAATKASTSRDDAALLERLCRGEKAERATRGRACFALARRTARGSGALKRDLAQAALLFRRGCRAGQQRACARAGQMYFAGSGVAADVARARVLLSSACDAKIALACHHLGLLLAHARDNKRAASLQQRACEQRVAAACHALATLHESGDGVPKDGAAASSFYQKACMLGHASSCDAAKRHLALSAWGDWARAAKATIERLEVAGPLAKQVVAQPMQRHLAQIKFCYQQQLLRDRRLAGKLELRFTITARGRVRQASVRASELSGRKVGPCVVRLSRRWRFEPPRFGAIAKVALTLSFAAQLTVASAQAPPSKHPPAVASGKPYGRRHGWVYLGEYSGGRWRTRYFKIATRARPSSLVGRTLQASARCNLRAAPPSVIGEMGRIVGGLPPRSKVSVEAAKPWLDSGFIWARVRVQN